MARNQYTVSGPKPSGGMGSQFPPDTSVAQEVEKLRREVKKCRKEMEKKRIAREEQEKIRVQEEQNRLLKYYLEQQYFNPCGMLDWDPFMRRALGYKKKGKGHYT